jgi:hypothetical protein
VGGAGIHSVPFHNHLPSGESVGWVIYKSYQSSIKNIPCYLILGNSDEKGYEWIASEDGKNWYRTQGTKDDWVEFSN